ncbi:MAG: RsmD family RNA methyltransferase [Myxococcota bacterium]
MRIIAGTLRGRGIRMPAEAGVRPTSDRVREAIASALHAKNRIEGCRMLDLFSGSGAMGLEILSRGGAHVLAVDRNRKLTQSLQRTAESLGVGTRLTTLNLDLFRLDRAIARLKTAPGPWNLIFMDPPYDDLHRVEALPSALAAHALVTADATFVCEHRTKDSIDLGPALQITDTYRYGDTAVTMAALSETKT